MAFGKKRDREESAGFGDDTGQIGDLAGEDLPASGRLTPVHVQEKVFRLAFRGYNEREVDEFLDVVTEELAALHEENKRLREEVDLGGGGGASAEEARQHAEETVRKAREEAARILASAEQGTGGAGTAVSAAFLSRERDFLQELAQLVQSHADALRSEAGRVREESAKPAPPPASKPAPTSKPKAKKEPKTAPAASMESSDAPESAPVGRGGSGGGAVDDDEPSLRELFWGEE